MNKLSYNPDVLSCLANLSNDEVFTPPSLANQMLDMLPQELFRSPETKFLDPCSKSGVFLREIAKRLIEGLADKIPDLQERIDHIMHHQLYGIAITRLTSLMSRRSLYCSKDASGKYSLSHFDAEDGNIRFKDIRHSWQNGKCRYCGASQEVSDRGDGLESYAYEFIHTDNPQKLYNNMTFDVIIGNPPYQQAIAGGGSTDRAIPVYNLFYDVAKKLKPNYISMIIPSKWMVGGFGLKEFRNTMMKDRSIKAIVDFENSSDCFPGVHIDGGVCFFLQDSNYYGKTTYEFHANDGQIIKSERYLDNKHFDYLIRDGRILSVIDKLNLKEKFSSIVSTMNPFGVNTYLFNEPERMPEACLKDYKYPDSVEVHGVEGIKGGAKRKIGYIKRKCVISNSNWVDKYKTFFSCTYSSNAINYPIPILAGPGVVCTGTFLVIGPFSTKEEQENCDTYMKTHFFKVLLYLGKGTMHVTRSVFGLIPLQDFSKPWTDEELYKKYGLTDEEIQFIESMIRPME